MKKLFSASKSLKKQQAIAGYLFILPNFVGFLAFIFVPLLWSLGISLFNWNLIEPAKFIGAGNYLRMFKDPLFRKTLYNTLYYTLTSVPLVIVLGLLLAVLVNGVRRLTMTYRLAIFLPYLIPMVGAALIWQSIYMPNFGILDYIFDLLGLPILPWLTSPSWAMPAIVVMSVWKGIGFTFIIFLAGLQGIPGMYYEAAEIDGANGIQQFFKITLPLLTPTIFFAVVITFIDSLKVFDQAFVLTAGGPANATKTTVYYLYEQGFQYLRMGYASAVGWFLLVVIFLITLLQFVFQRKWVTYE